MRLTLKLKLPTKGGKDHEEGSAAELVSKRRKTGMVTKRPAKKKRLRRCSVHSGHGGNFYSLKKREEIGR